MFFHEPRQVFRVKRSLPSPPAAFCRGKPRIFLPAPVGKLIPTVVQNAISLRGNCVDDLPEPGLVLLDLVKRLSERFLRPLAFNGDAGDMPGSFYERKVFFARNSRLMGVKGKSAQHLVVLRQDRLGPCGSYPVPNSEVAILIGPVWLRGDIGDNDSFLQKCCGPA